MSTPNWLLASVTERMLLMEFMSVFEVPVSMGVSAVGEAPTATAAAPSRALFAENRIFPMKISSVFVSSNVKRTPRRF